MQQRVGGAGDGGVHQDGVFEALPGDDVPRPHAFRPRQADRLRAGPAGVFQQVGAVGGQQGAAGQGQAQGLGQDLHGGSRADEAAGAASGAGAALGPVQLLPVDFPALVFRAVHAQLLQSQQVGAGGHGAARDDDRGNIQPRQAHQAAGQALVAAGDEHARVEGRGARLDLDHVGDHLPAGQGEVDAVVALAFAVAHVGAEIPRAVSAGFGRAAARLFHQPVQVAGAGVAVAEGALNKDLHLAQVLRFPSGTDAQGIELGSQLSQFLAWKHHVHLRLRPPGREACSLFFCPAARPGRGFRNPADCEPSIAQEAGRVKDPAEARNLPVPFFIFFSEFF